METETRAVLPVLLGAQGVAVTEADPERAKEVMFEEDEKSSMRSLGKERVAASEEPKSWCRRRFVLFLPFGLVLVVSPMVLLCGPSKETGAEGTSRWAVKAGLLMFSSLVSGLAGAFVLTRAATWYRWSTAGLLLWNWATGLLQAVALSVKIYGEPLTLVEQMQDWRLFLLIILLAFFSSVGIAWLLVLSVEQLDTLQSAARQQFSRNLWQQCVCAGTCFAMTNFLFTAGSFVTGILIFQQIEIETDEVSLQALWPAMVGLLLLSLILGVSWIFILVVYCKILATSAKIQATLTAMKRAMEDSVPSGSIACYAAFKHAQKVTRRQAWGLRLCFVGGMVFSLAASLTGSFVDGLVGKVLASGGVLINTCGILIMSKAHQLAGKASFRVWRRTRSSQSAPSMEPAWCEKVTELAGRGITVQALLAFYKDLGRSHMAHYQPSCHTTGDVVRQAIIPATRQEKCAYATVAGFGSPAQPQKMVTHSWQNLFRDLVAAVIADAVHESSFDLVAKFLEEDISVLDSMLQQQGALEKVYWICAFSVNQHAGICGGNPKKERDSVTGEVHDTCDCDLPKIFNSTPPLCDGQSIDCEMNKFDDMMKLLASCRSDFSQVVAVDSQFNLFSRAWCVAELVEADDMKLKQHVKMHSRPLLERRAASLADLRVENMEASHQEDVDYILKKIADPAKFNRKLHKLIFDKAGLLSRWRQLDAAQQMQEVGSLLKWGSADQGKGIVWQYWNKLD